MYSLREKKKKNTITPAYYCPTTRFQRQHKSRKSFSTLIGEKLYTRETLKLGTDSGSQGITCGRRGRARQASAAAAISIRRAPPGVAPGHWMSLNEPTIHHVVGRPRESRGRFSWRRLFLVMRLGAEYYVSPGLRLYTARREGEMMMKERRRNYQGETFSSGIDDKEILLNRDAWQCSARQSLQGILWPGISMCGWICAGTVW